MSGNIAEKISDSLCSSEKYFGLYFQKTWPEIYVLFLEFSHEWGKSPEKMSTLITMLEVTQNASNYRESKPINQM